VKNEKKIQGNVHINFDVENARKRLQRDAAQDTFFLQLFQAGFF
jgi:hypothetical protein